VAVVVRVGVGDGVVVRVKVGVAVVVLVAVAVTVAVDDAVTVAVGMAVGSEAVGTPIVRAHAVAKALPKNVAMSLKK